VEKGNNGFEQQMLSINFSRQYQFPNFESHSTKSSIPVLQYSIIPLFRFMAKPIYPYPAWQIRLSSIEQKPVAIILASWREID
jgi:hypothetical protein